MQNQTLIITPHEIIRANFACNKCGTIIETFFVGQAALEYVGCNCNSTAVRVAGPFLMKAADPQPNPEVILKK